METSNSKHHLDVEIQVINLVCSVCEIEIKDHNVELNSSIKDLGIDSIRFMSLLIGIEEIIDCEIEDVIAEIEFSELKTVGDIAELVKKFKR
ncbi:MAG: acyl carrier protein [Bacteroidetes bacterium]|nr:acyl carrier protein [Bacteroidota bacterium]